jgi:photosystem II stability/assembly factor-like uncharacterized protein
LKIQKPTILAFILTLTLSLLPHGEASADPAPGGWTALNNPSVPGGDVNFLVRAPSNADILYAGLNYPYCCNNGPMLYRSQDGGQTWQDTHNQRLPMYSLAVDAQDPNVLYSTDQDQLSRSLDGGTSWLPFYPFGYAVAAPSPGRIYLVGSTPSSNCPSGASSDFARSLDSGQTWQRIPVQCGQLPNHMFVNPSNPDQIFLSWNGYVPITYTSQDGGLTWQVLEINTTPLGIIDIVFDPAHPGRFYLITSEYALWTSEDNGTNWDACSKRSGSQSYPYLLQFSQGNLYMIDQAGDPSDHLYHVYRSQDQCASWWQSIGGLPSFVKTFLAISSIPEKLVAATQGYGIFLSSNGGSTWEESNTGLFSPVVVSQLAIAPSDPNVLLAGGSFPRPALYRSVDGGQNWSYQILDASAVSLLIDPVDPQKAWMATSTGIFLSPDGVTWNQNYKGPQYILQLALSPADPGHPYAAGGDFQQGYVFHWGSCALDCSTSYWIPRPISGSTLIREIAVNPRDGQDLLAGGYSINSAGAHSVIYRSTDGGKSWHEVLRKNHINQIRQIGIDPSNPSLRYALVDQLGILRSQDSGETWQSWPGLLLPYGEGSKLEVDDIGVVYLITNDGIYHRSVFDAGWTLLPAPISSFTTGAFWRGSSPFAIAAGWDGLFRLNLPAVRRLWLPILRR